MTAQTTSEWWEQAVRGNATAIRADLPQCGYYATRGQSGTTLLPARIWREFGQWGCTICGEPADALKSWPYLARRPIAAATYEIMMNAMKRHGSPREARKASILDLPPAMGTKR